MKATTQQILNLLKAENFSKLNPLKEKVESLDWTRREHQEIPFDESFLELQSIIEILTQAIEEKNNLFENGTSHQERHNIFSHLNSLNNYITNIKSDSDNINNFIQSVDSLKELIRRISIRLNTKDYPNYQEKLKQVNYLKSRYESLIQSLNEGEIIQNKAKEILNSVEESQNKVDSILKEAEDTKTTITSTQDDIETRHAEIKTLNTNITEYKTASQQNKEAIDKFVSQVQNFEEKMNKGLTDISETIKNSKETMNKNIQDHKQETDEIVKKNTILQEKILDILGSAIGTNLYKSFNQKAKWMKYQSAFWLVLLALSIWFLSDTGAWILEELKPLFEEGKTLNLEITFYLRLMLIFPAIYAVYFCAHQFKITSRLLEEYDFKSSVAVALNHFKELVEEANTDENTQNFLTDSIKTIFESPTEKVFGKKTKDIVSNVADIAGKVLTTKESKI